MDKDDKVYKVYKYTNLINGKVYIGRTKTSLLARAGHEGKKYYTQKYFGAAIKKYGWNNFKGEILQDNLSYDECCIKEKEYIKLYDSMNSKKGYNLAEGGEGPTKECLEKMREAHNNKKLSEEHKKKISQSLGQGVNNVNYGKKQTAEARLHNSMAKSGKNHPNWGKHLTDSTKDKIKEAVGNPILQFDLNNIFIKEWDDAKDAANELNINYKGINNCLRGIRHSSGGFIWRYKDNELYNKYANNRYILENYGIRSFKKKDIILKELNNQEQSSTTIPEMGVD